MQARIAAAALAVAGPRGLGSAARAATARPRVEETVLAGVPSTVYRPGRGRGPWAPVLVVPGITRRGRAHPAFAAIGRALAAAGHLAVVAEPGQVSLGELQPALVTAAREAALALLGGGDAREGGLGLAGVSGGGTIALLLAAEAALAERVAAVAALAPSCDIEQALRVGTTGSYRDAGAILPFAPESFARLVVARSVVASLPEGPDRDALRSHLLALADDDPDPLEGLRAWPRRGLGAPARKALDLLCNEDPARFDELLAGLTAEQQDAIAALSPIRVAARIRAPVEIVVGRSDKYFPFADVAAFADACPGARLTVVDSLAHAEPSLRPRELRNLAALDRALVRFLGAVRAGTRMTHTSSR